MLHIVKGLSHLHVENSTVELYFWHTDILSKPLSPGQVVPGPQDPVLRCGAVPLLCSHQE